MKNNGELGLIRNTPFGNSFTKDFALETIKNENMGKESATDFFSVSFSSTDNIGHQFGPQSIEVEDCYLRLDKDIAEILKFLDDWVGKKNVLVFLTADHGASEAIQCLLKKKIPAGELEEKPISDSLNKFFVQAFGDSLLLKVSDFDVYFDRKKIYAKKLNLDTVQIRTAHFMLGINGVADVITAKDIQNNIFQDPIR
jgi:predicted AlkP superfamily pyrophosphatase or phosphodiesterase